MQFLCFLIYPQKFDAYFLNKNGNHLYTWFALELQIFFGDMLQHTQKPQKFGVFE